MEFCEACKCYRYIGLCYGAAGVGKTLSARHYAQWDVVRAYWDPPGGPSRLLKEVSTGTTVFYTARVVSSPGRVERDIQDGRHLRHAAARRRAEIRENARTMRLFNRANELGGRGVSFDAVRAEQALAAANAFRSQRDRAPRVVNAVRDPTELVVIDEADRLREIGLEQVRDIFDRGGIGLVLIGMPGLEKRLARYPQLYSRIGFVHEVRPLSASAVRQLLEGGWAPPGAHLPGGPLDEETVAAIIRITRGNFRLLTRLLTQTERLLAVNSLRKVTREVIEAARESLVIGEA